MLAQAVAAAPLAMRFEEGGVGGAGAMSPPKWTAERLVHAATSLYGASADAVERRAADRELSSFQRCDTAVSLSMQLLEDFAGWAAATGPSVAQALTLLLAQTTQKRLHRLPSLKGRVPAADDVLGLAEMVRARDGGRHTLAAETLARGVGALWVHNGALPLEQALSALAASGASPRGVVVLAALAAVPEEAASKDLSSEHRAQAVRAVSAGAMQVLGALADLQEIPADPRLAAAATWLRVADASEAILALGTSSLVPLALQRAASSGEGAMAAMGRGGSSADAASEFLDTLLKQSGTSAAALAPLLDVVLGLLAVARPTSQEAKRALGKFVADAVVSWSWLFVAASTPLSPQWERLLEALVTSGSWGAESAVVTLHAWLSLHASVQKAGLSAQYAPVFVGAVRALRAVSRFPEGFEALTLEAQDAFREFRDELRDTLRKLSCASAEVLASFVDQVCKEALAAPAESSWASREEPLHALSAVAGAVCQGLPGESETAPISKAAVVALQSLAALAQAATTLFEHRQLMCTFLICASVYVPLLALPHRSPNSVMSAVGAQGHGLDAALVNVLLVARFSLSVPQECRELPDAAFPFRAKQDHAGAVCILKFCMSCSLELAAGSAELFHALRADHAALLQSLAQGTPTALPQPAVLVLTQALALVAVYSPGHTHDLLADCLAAFSLVSALPSGAPLAVVAEVLKQCRRQTDAVGKALEARWAVLAEACRLSEPAVLAKALAAVADAAPLAVLEALSMLVATTFEGRREARVALFDPVVALAHRSRQTGDGTVARLVSELVLGLSHLAWAEVTEGPAELRLQFLGDATRRAASQPEACGARERALLEAWARCVLEVGRRVPAALGPEASRLFLRAAVAALAAPHTEPPQRTLAALSNVWADEALAARWRAALEEELMPEKAVATLLLLALLKALSGQMPSTCVGTVVPAIKAARQLGGPELFEQWLRSAVEGEGFLQSSIKADAKERFVKDVSASAEQNPTHFKQLLKRLCMSRPVT